MGLAESFSRDAESRRAAFDKEAAGAERVRWFVEEEVLEEHDGLVQLQAAVPVRC
ncbi:MAG: hypothetical protein HY717_15140 [Planctomycetes bacterium]|nr:hypothetical protein [Planctomycetota bacterium]